MIIINAPKDLIEVQCYTCKIIMKAHPMSNMNSDYFTNCQSHRKQCKHEDENMAYEFHHPGELGALKIRRCKHCREFYK